MEDMLAKVLTAVGAVGWTMAFPRDAEQVRYIIIGEPDEVDRIIGILGKAEADALEAE